MLATKEAQRHCAALDERRHGFLDEERVLYASSECVQRKGRGENRVCARYSIVTEAESESETSKDSCRPTLEDSGRRTSSEVSATPIAKGQVERLSSESYERCHVPAAITMRKKCSRNSHRDDDEASEDRGEQQDEDEDDEDAWLGEGQRGKGSRRAASTGRGKRGRPCGRAFDEEEGLVTGERRASPGFYAGKPMSVDEFIQKIYAILMLCLLATIIALGYFLVDRSARVFILERRLICYVILPIYLFFFAILWVFRSAFPANILLVVLLQNTSWFAGGMLTAVYLRA